MAEALQAPYRDMKGYVVRRLCRCRGQLGRISAQTGVSFWTLQKIKQGTIGNPGVNTIQTLFNYFEDHPDEGD